MSHWLTVGTCLILIGQNILDESTGGQLGWLTILSYTYDILECSIIAKILIFRWFDEQWLVTLDVITNELDMMTD